MNPYDNPAFFAEYAKMSRSQLGLAGAGEWHQLEPLFPELAGKMVLDLGYELKKYHHTLTHILNCLLQTGFAMEAIEEAMPPIEWRDQMPEEMKRPMMLLVRAKKPFREGAFSRWDVP